jgi:hypothetical protein
MAATRGPIGKGLEILRDALVPFVESTLATHYSTSAPWVDQVDQNRRGKGKAVLRRDASNRVYWSPDDLLNTITIGEWPAFKRSFKPRSIAPSTSPNEDFVVKGWIEEIMETRRRDMRSKGSMNWPSCALKDSSMQLPINSILEESTGTITFKPSSKTATNYWCWTAFTATDKLSGKRLKRESAMRGRLR